MKKQTQNKPNSNPILSADLSGDLSAEALAKSEALAKTEALAKADALCGKNKSVSIRVTCPEPAEGIRG